MTEEEAKKIGSQQLMKFTFILVSIFELYWMYSETKGDFANGILFYISYHANPILWMFYILIFGSNYLFGKNAGKEIIILKNNAFITSLKFGLFISSEIILFQIIALVINKQEIISNLLHSLIRVFGMLSIWLWAVRQIKLKGKKVD